MKRETSIRGNVFFFLIPSSTVTHHFWIVSEPMTALVMNIEAAVPAYVVSDITNASGMFSTFNC